MSRYKELKIASVSDIHLGHRTNKTTDIVKNLRTAFPDNLETGELDIIFIAGDVFDGLLTLDDNPYIADIDLWIGNLLSICSKRNIILRVLKGTPSHDWDQSKRFEIIKQVCKYECDLKYVDNLHIEFIEALGINVLYIPDELESTSEKTLNRVKDMIKSKGLETVDYAIMHGQFEFQLPEFVKAQKHDSSEYLNLVSGLIFIGHVHKSSQFKRIIAQGSFDRLSHGEEEPKGHMRAIRKKDGTHEITFIENKNAKKYITVSCLDNSLEDSLTIIEKNVIDLPNDSCVRVELTPENPLSGNMDVLIRLYPTFNWTKIVRIEDEDDYIEIIDDEVFSAITLTRDNLSQLLIPRIANKGCIDILEAAELILNECL